MFNPRPSASIPLDLARRPDLSDTVLRTWLLLRLLAADTGQLPPLDRGELAGFIGKCQSILNLHLARLRDLGLLDWEVAGRGRILITLNPLTASPESSESPARDYETSQNISGFSETLSEIPERDSEKPLEKTRAGDISAPKRAHSEKSERPLSFNSLELKTDLIKDSRARPGSRNFKKPAPPEPTEPPPADENALEAYRRIVGRRPNPAQRELIQARVTDLPLWRATLQHWLAHGWNPLNLPGMLDLYGRGGPSACTRCAPASSAKKAHPLQELVEKYVGPGNA